jgi:hypothetical protein
MTNKKCLSMHLTTRDRDIIASRVAVRYFFNQGWEVADLNNLLPFSSGYRVAPDIVERYARNGPMKFLQEELSREDPRILFFYLRDTGLSEQLALRMHYKRIPEELAHLILDISNPRSNYMPIDYLVLDSEEYVFVELKSNASKPSKKQRKIAKKIEDAGYRVLLSHISFKIDTHASVELNELSLKG